MSELFSGTREVGYYGESQTFSISANTNSLSLGITLIQVPGTGTDTDGGTDTGGGTDNMAPTVTFSPANGATGVPISNNITIIFSEAVRNIDNTVLTDSNSGDANGVGSLITLRLNNTYGTNIAFYATIDTNKTVITIDPTNNLPHSQAVYVAIGATVEDSAGNPITAENATFTTVQETTVPTVSSIYPADNQNGVSISDNISVTFSEAMDSTYVTTSTSDTNCAGNIWVSSDNFSSCVRMSSEPASSNSNMTFTLDPHDNLTVGTTYKTRVTTGVKDTAGNSMSSQYETSSGFTPADLTAPTVTSVSTTADNQSSVAITDNITLTFSEAMDSTSVTTNTGDTSCSGTLGVSSDNFSSCVQMSSFPARSNDNMTFTIDPSDNLTGGTTYLTRVTTGVKDSAGNTLSSQYVTSSGFTTADYALNFDGTNDYVSIPNDPFSNNNTFTIQAWLKPEVVGDGAFHGFVGIQPSGYNTRKPSLWVSTGGDLHYDSYKGTDRFNGIISDGSNKFFTADEWVHVAWTNDGSNYKFYKNGNLVATETAPDTFNAPDDKGYEIGRVDNYFNGQLDEVAIWNVALSSADITSLYNSGNGLKASADSGNYDNSGELIGYWKFNDGTGSTLTDSTSNSNNGTLTNMDSSDWVTSGFNLID